MNGVQDQNKASLNHVPFVPGQFINNIRNECVIRNSKSTKHALLPEAATSNIGSESIDSAEDYNAFDRTGDKAESESLRVVFIPSLDIEGKESYGLMSEHFFFKVVTPMQFDDLPPKRTMTVFHPIPKFCEAAKIRHSREVFTASTP